MSRICAELDGYLEALRTRRLEGGLSYMFADATYVKARARGRVVSRAVVVATGARSDGAREVLGIDIGDSEDGAFWRAFFRSLRARGLSGVQLVISDHHLGLKAAIAAMFVGPDWLQCRAHFVRNALARVPKGSTEIVAAAIPTIFAQPEATHVRSQLAEIVGMLRAQFPDVAAMLADSAEDLLAFTITPPGCTAPWGTFRPSSGSCATVWKRYRPHNHVSGRRGEGQASSSASTSGTPV